MFFVPIYSNNANAVLLGACIGQIIAVLGAYELFISPSITKILYYNEQFIIRFYFVFRTVIN